MVQLPLATACPTSFALRSRVLIYSSSAKLVNTASEEEHSEVYGIADPPTRFKPDKRKPLGFPLSRNEKGE